MPDGISFERPSGIEHREGVDALLHMDAHDGGATFTFNTEDKNLHAVLNHVLTDRYGIKRLHTDTYKRRDLQVMIDIPDPDAEDVPGMRAVTPEDRDQIVSEVETTLKRMGITQKTPGDTQEKAA